MAYNDIHVFISDLAKEMNDRKHTPPYVYPILETKLFIPGLKSGMVRRKKLIARMNEGINRKLILISAPAGFGKTTLLSEWISQREEPAAWISIDSSDNDPVYFVQYMIAALKTVVPGFGDDVLEFLKASNEIKTEAIMLLLIKGIEKLESGLILALDDYHLINTDKINPLVELLLDRMPRQVCLAIATRADPGFPLSRLRVTDQLAEFRISDLYFTKAETSQFLNNMMQLDLTQTQVDQLASRTEGWIAGLQLAALSIKGRDDVPTFIDSFAGNDRLVADYLAEEVLRRQPDDVQQFLIQTSILSRLCEPLCEHITCQGNSQSILESLERGNLFLIPLDSKRQWYRYHHLFADLLRQKLLLNSREFIGRLHRKASEWYENNRLIEDAIEHAFEAKDYERAAELIGTFLEASWIGGEQVTLISWLKILPEKYIYSNNNLCICHARVLFESGHREQAEECLNRLESSLQVKPSELLKDIDSNKDPLFTATQGRIAALRTYWATLKGDLDSIEQYSQQALDQLSQDDAAWRMMVFLGASVSHEVKGNMKEAIKAHFGAVAAAKQAGSVYFYMITRVWLAIELNILGRMPEAIEVCRQLLKEVDEKKLTLNIAKGHVFGTWAEIIYEHNELDQAYDYARKAIAYLEEGHDIHHIGWRYTCLGRILCSLQDISGAKAIVPRMEEILSTQAVPPWVSSHIEAVRARIWFMENNTGKIDSWIEQNLQEPDGGMNRFVEAKYVQLARILASLHRYDEAQRIISPLLPKQEKDGRKLHQVETLMIQARIFQMTDRGEQATNALLEAFAIAASGGYIRVFTDEWQFVSQLMDQFSVSQREEHRNFILKLTAASEKGRQFSQPSCLVEPLSDREMEVLQLISAGFSNKKTAESLYISVNTLKTHLQNIYGKLGVHNRTEAVYKAKEFNLL